jgi:hypothetical protein
MLSNLLLIKNIYCNQLQSLSTYIVFQTTSGIHWHSGGGGKLCSHPKEQNSRAANWASKLILYVKKVDFLCSVFELLRNVILNYINEHDV